MAQKRPPLPIFNKNKRPRQALVAHPNNGAAQQRNFHQPPRTFHSSNTPTSYNQLYQLPKTNKSSYSCHALTQGQENRMTTASPYNATHSYGNASHEQDWQRETRHDHTMRDSFRPKQQSQFTRLHPTSQSTPRPAVPTQVSVASGSEAVGAAKEPSREMAAQHSFQSKPVKHKPTLRVLTATAQGMKHWSKYKNNSPLLFEVFGRLSSPTTLVRNQTKCKQFQLTTTDGPLTCTFWEMSHCLPPLVQGRLLRVVGQWEGEDHVMKCYSVRETVKGEETAGRKAVEVSDKTMRQFVAKIHQ